jgi:hypothetical protein
MRVVGSLRVVVIGSHRAMGLFAPCDAPAVSTRANGKRVAGVERRYGFVRRERL